MYAKNSRNKLQVIRAVTLEASQQARQENLTRLTQKDVAYCNKEIGLA